jgi:hypothetical protein
MACKQEVEFQYYTYFRGGKVEGAGKKKDELETHRVLARACDQRPKQGFRCEGLDFTKLRGVSYATFEVEVEKEFARCAEVTAKVKDLEAREAALAAEMCKLKTRRGAPRSRTACVKEKKAKVCIEVPNVGSKVEPLCNVTVNNMDETTSLRLALTLVGTLYEKPIFRGRCKRTKAELWELVMEGVTFEDAAHLKDVVCKLLWAEGNSHDGKHGGKQ